MYPIYYADNVFWPLWAILRSQKYNEEKIYSIRTLVVHILSFQRDLVVLWLSILSSFASLDMTNIFFDVFLAVHFSIFISVINQLDAQNFCFTISLFRSLYMFRAHVLIIRRSKLHYTASGIITPIGGRLMHRLREDFSLLSTCV